MATLSASMRILSHGLPRCSTKFGNFRACSTVWRGGGIGVSTIPRMKRQRERSGKSAKWPMKPAFSNPFLALSQGISSRRQNKWARLAPASAAVIALSKAEAPAPSTATSAPFKAAKSISSAACAQLSDGSASVNPTGTCLPPLPSRPVANTTRRARSNDSVPFRETVTCTSSASPSMVKTLVSFWTGRSRTSRYHIRYAIHSWRGRRSSAAQDACPYFASQ